MAYGRSHLGSHEPDLQKFTMSNQIPTSDKENLEHKISIIFLALFLVFALLKINELLDSFKHNGWVTGDWLINYAPGFIRRGLAGEVLIRFCDLLNLDLIKTLTSTKKLIYASIFTCFVIIAYRRSIGIIELILFMAPWGVMLNLNSPEAVGRKEITLFFAFCLYIVIRNESSITTINKKARTIFLTILFITLTAIHEGLFFFLQIFAFHAYLKRDEFFNNYLSEFSIAYISSAVAILALLFIFPDKVGYGEIICADLMAHGLPTTICTEGQAIDIIGKLKLNFGVGKLPHHFGTQIALSFTPIYLYGLSIFPRKLAYKYTTAFLLAIAPTTLLYATAGDWGRWIYITLILMYLSILSTKDPSTKINLTSPISLFFIIFNPFFYIFEWYVPHYYYSPPESLTPMQDINTWLSRF